MSTELIINASLPETRIALMENGEIQDLLIERASGKGIVGNIYKGRVTRVLPGMQAAFVDIGLEKAAFLYVDDVFVHSDHSEVFEDEEESTVTGSAKALAEVTGEGSGESSEGPVITPVGASADQQFSNDQQSPGQSAGEEAADEAAEALDFADEEGSDESDDEEDDQEDVEGHDDDEDEDEDDDHGPVGMAAKGGDGEDDNAGNRAPDDAHPGTVAPGAGEYQAGEGQQQPRESSNESGRESGQEAGDVSASSAGGEGEAGPAGEGGVGPDGEPRRRHRRGRRGGRFRSRRGRGEGGPDEVNEKGEKIQKAPKIQGASVIIGQAGGQTGGQTGDQEYPANFVEQVSDSGDDTHSDRADMTGDAGHGPGQGNDLLEGEGRPHTPHSTGGDVRRQASGPGRGDKQAFKSQRSKDRRVPSRSSRRPVRAQVNIQDLLKEGQEVLVQVAKDPIATKGARLTCHISLPGRHLVCMPTIDHVGVSRRIERDDERRKLRDIVEGYRPRNLGFIVRTASGRGQAERRIKQDIDYLSRLWDEIREKAASVTAPALVYEDLNSVLRAIRDWVTEDIDKIIVDSRYHYNDIQRFVSHFMPSLKQKVELYHGDIPIFDAYNISTELSRALERKVWLKSGGYLVIDQAEALVAIDVNTGRYVGKKNLEDTILKTNLEAVQEIAYQLRLRNCGGIIILDLIDMERDENKQRVYRALEEAIKRDRARPTIIKISELGLVEMTRKRTRDTIVRSLCESCSHCEGKGFIKSKTTVGYEVLREIEREVIERDVSKILVQAHPDVIDILAIEERETLDQIERRYRKQVYLQGMTDFHPEQFEVAGDKKPGKQAGEFSEVVQTLRGVGAPPEREGGRDREQGRGGGGRGGRDRDRGRGGRGGRGDKDRGGRDSGRDREQKPPVVGGGGPVITDGPSVSASRAAQGSGDVAQQPLDGVEQAPRARIIINPNPNPIAPTNGHRVERTQNDQGADGNQENLGNFAPQEGGGSAGGPVVIIPRTPVAGDDDFFENEEDRLAFLRAQAAQDAALARLSSGAAPSTHRAPGGGGAGRGGDRDRGGSGGPGGRGRRGRRGTSGGGPSGGGGGGKFGRGGGRAQRDFAPGAGPGNGSGPVGRGPRGNGNEGGGGQGGPAGGGPTSGGDGGGGGGGGNPDGGGGGSEMRGTGGGEHSTPPTV